MAMTSTERVAAHRARRRTPDEDHFEKVLDVLVQHARDPQGDFASATARAKVMYSDDDSVRAAVRMHTRSGTTPADTTTSGWAADLSVGRPGPLLESLTHVGGLLSLVEKVDLSGMSVMQYPKPASAIPESDIPWIGQGQPIGAQNLSIDSVAVGPLHKLGVLVGLTHETVSRTDGKRIAASMVKAKIDMSLGPRNHYVGLPGRRNYGSQYPDSHVGLQRRRFLPIHFRLHVGLVNVMGEAQDIIRDAWATVGRVENRAAEWAQQSPSRRLWSLPAAPQREIEMTDTPEKNWGDWDSWCEQHVARGIEVAVDVLGQEVGEPERALLLRIEALERTINDMRADQIAEHAAKVINFRDLRKDNAA